MGKNNLHYAICFYAQEVHGTSVPGQGQIINLKQKVHDTRYAPLTSSLKWALCAPRTAQPSLLCCSSVQGSTRRKRL